MPMRLPDPLHLSVFRPGRAVGHAGCRHTQASPDTHVKLLTAPAASKFEWDMTPDEKQCGITSDCPSLHVEPRGTQIQHLGAQTGQWGRGGSSWAVNPLSPHRPLNWRAWRSRVGPPGRDCVLAGCGCPVTCCVLTAQCSRDWRASLPFPFSSLSLHWGCSFQIKTWTLILTLCLFSGKLKLEFSCVFNFCVYV